MIDSEYVRGLIGGPSSHPDRFPTHKEREAERRQRFAVIEDLEKQKNPTSEEEF